MNNLQVNTQVPRFKALLDLPMLKLSRPLGIALAIFLMLSTLSAPLHAAATSDPLEKVNRLSFQFNKTLDRFIVRPLAVSYDRLAPELVKTGVHNFFSNLDDIQVTFNDLMQLKFSQAAADFSRLAVNTTVGIGGLIDVAGPVLELKKNQQDFGRTLASWGVESGPYLVLPVFSPSSLRDGFGVGVDSLLDPVPALDHNATRNSLLLAESTEFRAGVLYFDDLVSGDEYLFVREFYLQYREYSNNDGKLDLAFEEF